VAFFIPKNMEFLPTEIGEYALAHTTKEPRLLAELNQIGRAHV
jgi:hypothetical protein